MDKSHDADLHNRLLTIMGVNSLLKDSKNLRDKILFEPVPSGDKFLAPIIEALRDEYAIQITHQGFGKSYPSTYLVEAEVVYVGIFTGHRRYACLWS